MNQQIACKVFKTRAASTRNESAPSFFGVVPENALLAPVEWRTGRMGAEQIRLLCQILGSSDSSTRVLALHSKNTPSSRSAIPARRHAE